MGAKARTTKPIRSGSVPNSELRTPKSPHPSNPDSEPRTPNYTANRRVASYALHPGDTLAAAARKIVSKQAARMKAKIEGTRAGVDPEALHDMRVATRRLRFALRLFGPWMPTGRADRLRADLRRVALSLGRVRDLEVFLENLPPLMERAGLTAEERRAVVSALRRKRAQGRAALVRMLAGRRFLTLVLVLERVPMAAAEAPAREEAGVMLRRAVRALRRWGRKADRVRPEDLHRLRILFKRLRYTCEYFNDLYGGAFDGAIARFIQFQDCLGRIQDTVIAASLLDRIIIGDCPYLRSGARSLQAVLREQRGLQREAFVELWSGFPLTMRAFGRLLRSLPPSPPAPPAAVAPSVSTR